MPSRLCTIDGCDRPARARGLCKKHLARLYRTGSPHAVRRSTPGPRRPARIDPSIDLDRLAATTPAAHWWDQARCRAVGHHAFYPTKGTGPQAHQGASALCHTCPVRYDCLADVLDHERLATRSWRFGNWAATTPGARVHIARALRDRARSAA